MSKRGDAYGMKFDAAGFDAGREFMGMVREMMGTIGEQPTWTMGSSVSVDLKAGGGVYTSNTRWSELEGGKGWKLEADLPGYDPQTTDIDLTNDVLTIKAWRVVGVPNQTHPKPDYETQWKLGKEIDRDNIVATQVNGLLKILFAPAPTVASGRKIPVNGG